MVVVAELEPRDVHMTVEVYLAYERTSEVKHEYVDGHVYAMAGGTLDHADIGTNVVLALRERLRGNACRVRNSDARVQVSATRYFYPDASISCHPDDRGAVVAVRYPTVVLEVLSDSTREYDRGDKFGHYRSSPTLEEYVLVETERREVEVFRREADGAWVGHRYRDAEDIELASVDVRCPVAAFYEDIDL